MLVRAAPIAGVAWVEQNIEETLSFYRLPRQHHKHLKRPTCGSG